MTDPARREKDPSLREVVFRDFRAADLPRQARQDIRQLYHFYLDEDRRAELAAMGGIRRAFKMFVWLLKSLLAKLAPGRRLALAVALLMCVFGLTSVPLLWITDQWIDLDLRLWGFLILLVVLMLELKDKVLARDEIEVARQVQVALLPRRHPQPAGWSIWSFMRPANDVGADLVDYIDLDGGRLGIVLGDVAGKGLGAALLTAKLQATLRALVPQCITLGDLGSRMNAILHRDGIDNRFATLFYFEIEPLTGRLRYLNAGHNPPFVLRRGGGLETLGASSIPLGMMQVVTCVEGALNLDPGDVLVVYSDGLTEARNARDEEFGADRLRSLLPSIKGLPAERAVEVVMQEVNAFLGEARPHDDLSLVVVARLA